ncbi:hypothetical protein IFM89_034724 [Coptis chinensis]|uniref:Thioredoxin domain-containing protein n=1 Tax=Coptis chinensis TaxID=261450 RepID=A0A835H8Q6_9MAGN|nr:hypothetical protein IFM89_034724 [Coptis chinensis]
MLSEALRTISPSLLLFSHSLHHPINPQHNNKSQTFPLVKKLSIYKLTAKTNGIITKPSAHAEGLDSPVSVELDLIVSEAQFDDVITEAQQAGNPLVVVWMATWCRKCIYLKPKLEKMAAEYYPGIRFYYVDVNTVPHKLVARAGVTVWKDSKKQAEVVGGHKAYLVVNEVREMIENVRSV